MSMLTLHHNATDEWEPLAIVEHGETPRGEEPKLVEATLRGWWLRVFPKTGKDVAFLRMLDHRVDKFAPAKEHGVLIRRNLFDHLTRRRS